MREVKAPIHGSIEEASFSEPTEEESAQLKLNLFNNECEGMCGV